MQRRQYLNYRRQDTRHVLSDRASEAKHDKQTCHPHYETLVYELLIPQSGIPRRQPIEASPQPYTGGRSTRDSTSIVHSQGREDHWPQWYHQQLRMAGSFDDLEERSQLSRRQSNRCYNVCVCVFCLSIMCNNRYVIVSICFSFGRHWALALHCSWLSFSGAV